VNVGCSFSSAYAYNPNNYYMISIDIANGETYFQCGASGDTCTANSQASIPFPIWVAEYANATGTFPTTAPTSGTWFPVDPVVVTTSQAGMTFANNDWYATSVPSGGLDWTIVSNVYTSLAAWQTGCNCGDTGATTANPQLTSAGSGGTLSWTPATQASWPPSGGPTAYTPTGSGVTSIGADLLACPPNGSTSTLGPRDYYNNSISTVCGGIYFVNHGGAYSLTSAATSFVLTTPSSLVNGNVLIAEITCLQGTSSSNSLTPPSGFTQIGSTTNLLYADGVYKNDAVYYHVVSGGEASSYTFTSVNACTGSGDIMQLSGGAGTYSYVVGPQAKVNTNATSTSISISGVGETYQSGEFAFYLGAMGNSAARQR
jgi:hypothetical protein